MAADKTSARDAVTLIGALAATPEHALGAFRALWLPGSAVDVEQLRRARAVVIALERAMLAGGKVGTIDALWAALGEVPSADQIDPRGEETAAMSITPPKKALPFERGAGAHGLPEAGEDAVREAGSPSSQRTALHTFVPPDATARLGLPFVNAAKTSGAPPDSTTAVRQGIAADIPGFSATAKAAAAIPPPPPRLAAMNVEGYAALCAACAMFPASLAEIHAEFGIQSAEEREGLECHWRQRIAANEELQRIWRAHYTRYCDGYRQG
jgi:hypothetical protein